MTVQAKSKYDKFFGEEWARNLSPFLNSNDYKRIGAEIMRQKAEGIEVTPDLENMFRAYKECPWHKIHSVILGQDVYPGRNRDKTFVADGIAFSAKECADPPASLNSILEAIDKSVFEGEYTASAVYNYERMESTWDLKPWANSGILLINCAYSTVVGRPNEHINVWAPFTQFVMKMLNEKKDALGFVLMGSHAKSYKRFITNFTHAVFECEHPAAAMYKGRKWEHNGVFRDLTDFQKRSNNIEIRW